MNKSEILKRFLDANLQINSEALQYFIDNQDKLEMFFSILKNKKIVISIKTKEIVGEIFPPGGISVKILKEFPI